MSDAVPTDPAALDALRAGLKQQGYALLRYDDGPVHSYPYDAPWLLDADFSQLYERIRDNTLVDRPRCHALYQLAHQVETVPGDVLEVGTWRGGTAAMLAAVRADRTTYVADTFAGVVKSADWEHYSDAAHDDTSREVVEALLAEVAPESDVRILAGVFPDETGPQLAVSALAFVHLDVDVYRSTKDAFEYVWDRVSPGGIVAFDDYGMVSACAGIARFVDEVRDDADKLFVPNLNGQAYLVKR